jgi:hypothetical protein
MKGIIFFCILTNNSVVKLNECEVQGEIDQRYRAPVWRQFFCTYLLVHHCHSLKSDYTQLNPKTILRGLEKRISDM